MFKALFMLKVTGSRSKVALGSDHDVAQLDHGRNNCAQFELLLGYSYRDLARKWQLPPACPAKMNEWLWGKNISILKYGWSVALCEIVCLYIIGQKCE